MGYAYGQSASGRWALSCDNCGKAEGTTRKRTCPRKMLAPSTRSAKRYEVHYCYPPALCPECWVRLGRAAGVHADCAQGAARTQAVYDEVERRFQAGEGYLISASGDWADDVPEGMTKVTFAFPPSGITGWREYLMPADEYVMAKWLTDPSYANARPMALVAS
jgi:hypothetical protein